MRERERISLILLLSSSLGWTTGEWRRGKKMGAERGKRRKESRNQAKKRDKIRERDDNTRGECGRGASLSHLSLSLSPSLTLMTSALIPGPKKVSYRRTRAGSAQT
jgi:hypothetical protein